MVLPSVTAEPFCHAIGQVESGACAPMNTGMRTSLTLGFLYKHLSVPGASPEICFGRPRERQAVYQATARHLTFGFSATATER